MNMPGQVKGFFCAIISAVTFGTNPLFGIPLYRMGYTPAEVLFYRFLLAALFMGIVVLVRKEGFKIPRQSLLPAAASGIFMALTCLLWFLTFKIMDSGISATLLYIYPVLVAVIMRVFFKEHLALPTLAGIILTLAGVILLCQPGNGAKINTRGVIYITLAALSYSIYITGIKGRRLRDISSGTLTFYVMIFAIPVFLVPLKMGLAIPVIRSWEAFGCLLGVAVVPSLLAYLFLNLAIKYIGPVKSSVFGAFEPLTAVVIGILCFGEPVSLKSAIAVILIIAAVTIVICGQSKTAAKTESAI